MYEDIKLRTRKRTQRISLKKDTVPSIRRNGKKNKRVKKQTSKIKDNSPISTTNQQQTNSQVDGSLKLNLRSSSNPCSSQKKSVSSTQAQQKVLLNGQVDDSFKLNTCSHSSTPNSKQKYLISTPDYQKINGNLNHSFKLCLRSASKPCSSERKSPVSITDSQKINNQVKSSINLNLRSSLNSSNCLISTPVHQKINGLGDRSIKLSLRSSLNSSNCRSKALISAPVHQKINGQGDRSIKLSLRSAVKSHNSKKISRNFAIDDLDAFNNSIQGAINNLKSRTKQNVQRQTSNKSKPIKTKLSSDIQFSNKSKTRKLPLKETKAQILKNTKSDPLPRGRRSSHHQKALGCSSNSKNTKTKVRGCKSKKKPKQPADVSLENTPIISPVKSSYKNSKGNEKQTSTPHRKKGKSIVLTQDHQKVTKKVNNCITLGSPIILNSRRSLRISRKLAVDDLDTLNVSFKETTHTVKSRTKVSVHSLNKYESMPEQLCLKKQSSKKSGKVQPVVKKTKVGDSTKTASGILSIGTPNSAPRKGSLKRKRWAMNMLNQKNEGYEDDIFESRKVNNFPAFFEDLADDESDHASIISIATPKFGFTLSPCLPKHSPLYKDCISSSELMEARKVAEEYIYRRNKKRKSDSRNESNPKTPISMSKTKASILLEKRRLDYSEALLSIASAQKDIEKFAQCESEDEDAYFSDVSD